MDEEVYIVLTVFGSFAIVFLAWFYFRHRARLEVQHTLRLALEKGNELSPEFMKQLGEAEPSRDRDLRRGVIWLALAFGLVLSGFAVPEPDSFRNFLAGASFPFAIGIAFMIMYRYGSKKES